MTNTEYRNLDLSTLTLVQLVAIHNELADRPIKTFRTKAQGVAVCDELISGLDVQEQVDAEGGVEASQPSFREAMDPGDPAPNGELASLVGAMTNGPQEAPAAPALVSLATICAEVKVVPRIARRRLRKAKGILTEGRWEFAPGQVEEVKALIVGSKAAAEAPAAATTEVKE